MRYVGHDLGFRCRTQIAATADFLFGHRYAHGGWLTRLFQTGITQEEGLVGDHLIGFRILERLALAENLPFFNAGVRYAGGVELIAGPDEDAVLLRGNHAHAGVQILAVDNQWLRNERLDFTGRDARNHLLNGFAVDRRLGAAFAGRACANPFGFAQAGRAGRHVEDNNVTRINPVRILDLASVHLPDFRPAPWLLEELAGNRPQGIALDDHMAIRRVIDQLKLVGGGSAYGRHGQDERGYNANHRHNLSCRWNALPL